MNTSEYKWHTMDILRLSSQEPKLTDTHAEIFLRCKKDVQQ